MQKILIQQQNSALNKTESLKIKKQLQNIYLEFYKTKLASSEKRTYYKHLNYDMAPYLSIIKNHNFR